MAQKGSVLITGCSDGGIGSSLALAFVQRGFRVFATARDEKSMSKLLNLDNLTLLTLDVVQPDHIQAAVEVVRRETGGTLSYLVNNAGQNRFMPLLDENIDDAKRLYDINVWGPLRLAQAFSPLLIEAKGTIVFTASVSGYLNVPWQGVYAASKRSEEIVADVLRLELAPFDVKVVSVVTGAVKSRVHEQYENWKLPENSRYAVVESSFVKRAKGDDGAPRMEPQVYADAVVSKICAGAGPKFWYGASAAVVKFASAWFPISWLDSGVAKGTGIDVMLQQK